MTGASESRQSNKLNEVENLREAEELQLPASLPAIEWCVIAIQAVFFIWLTLVPGWRSLLSEFPNYYLAAELYHQGIPVDRSYEWAWFQRQNDHLNVRDGLVSFAPNPPSSIIPLLPFTRLSPLAAKRAWMMCTLVLLALSLLALRQTTQLGWRRLILITSLSTLPLRVDFKFARYYVLILFLISVAYYAASRNKRLSSGLSWSAAAAMKLFPAISVILFIRKRDWRALSGFLVGTVALVSISIALFGMDVHQVFVREVLTQASRGDWLGPYSLYQNSFITLWSRFFLFEPQLNPAPLVNSPLIYSLLMALTVTALVFGFLLSIQNDDLPHAEALRWASLPPLMLLLSTYASADHSCILIFSAIVAIDALLARGQPRMAFALLIIYMLAAAPIPNKMTSYLPHRLVGMTAFYGLLLHNLSNGMLWREAKRWWILGLLSVIGLTISNYRTANHAEDFNRRVTISTDGYRFANPVPVGNSVGLTEMLRGKYRPILLSNGIVRDLSSSGDALSVAGSPASDAFYSEQAERTSLLIKIPANGVRETITEGQDPVLSSNGKWLAFIREDHESRSAWLLATDSAEAPQVVVPPTEQAIDVTVTNDGDVIAAGGKVSDPHLVRVNHGTGEVVSMAEIGHPVRYPAISPDGKRLAFSRREAGSWHLFIRTLANGSEWQLTHAPCNAISPAWESDHSLLYATDCGRGVGLSALARVAVPQ